MRCEADHLDGGVCSAALSADGRCPNGPGHAPALPEGWPITWTADGVPVTPGLWVWTNNYRKAQVTRYLHPERNQNTGTVAHWFDTTDCMVDESRMVTRLPDGNRERADS